MSADSLGFSRQRSEIPTLSAILNSRFPEILAKIDESTCSLPRSATAQTAGQARSKTLQQVGWGKMLAMNPWIAKAVVLAATVVMMAIRGPHGQRSRRVNVAKSHKTALETAVLVFAWVGFFVPLVWVASPAFELAEYPLRAVPLEYATYAARTKRLMPRVW
jgi:hypothetical protein